MDLDHPLNCLTFNLQRSARQRGRDFEHALKGLDLTAQQFATLAVLDAMGSQSIGQLAEMLDTDRTTLTRNLSRAEAQGWVETVETIDRRLRLYALTPDGAGLFARARPIWADHQARLVRSLGQDGARSLLRTLKDL